MAKKKKRDHEREAIQADHTEHADITFPPHVQNVVNDVVDALNAAEKRGTAEDITEKLTSSIKIAKLKKGETATLEPEVVEPIECKECSGYGQHIVMHHSGHVNDKSECTACNGTGFENHKEMQMAAKKKTAKKSKTNGHAVKSGGEKVHKILLRLSKDEYNSLQAKAAKQNISMASILRSAI